MIAVVGAALVFHAFTTDVGANKDAPQKTVTDDGVAIEDRGWGSSGEDCWTITDWDEVEIAKETFPDLMIPRYIPKGYEFEELVVEQITPKNIIYDYIFLNKSGETIELEISDIDTSGTTIDIDQISKILSSRKGEVYLQEDMQIATIQTDDGFSVWIWSNLSDEELVKLIDHLEV